MFEQDYIMRIIHEIIRTLLKLLFNIDEKKEENIEMTDEKSREIYDKLANLVDNGQINEAENQLYKILDINNKNGLLLALLFYDYVNVLDDETLEQYSFSRDEIKEGILNIAKIYGYESFVDAFLMVQ